MRVAVPVLLLASCAAPPPSPPPGPSLPPPEVLRKEAAEALAALERTFYEHWGSVEKTAPYARLGPAHVPCLREVADSNGELGLPAMRVIARLRPEERFSDAARAILYATALGREQNFARWGSISKSGFLPGVYGVELLRLKAAAVPYLRKLLSDKRRARVAGGEAEAVNAVQGDRVCDYAWVFLATILDRPLAYHPDPDKRDPQILELDLWLDRRR